METTSFSPDLIRLKELTERLTTTFDQVRLWFQHTPVLAAVVTSEKFLAVGGQWTSLLGYSDADLVGTDWQSLMHPEDVARAKAQFMKNEPGSVRLRLRGLDGDYEWFEWFCSTDHGGTLCVGGIPLSTIDMSVYQDGEESL
jgi:PAS domain S-box-containing protein